MVRDAIVTSAFLLASSFSNVDGDFFMKLLVAISASLVFYNQFKIARKPTTSDQIKESTKNFVQKNDCEHKCGATAAHLKKLEHDFNERMSAFSGHSANSRKALYDSISKLREDVAAIKKADELQTQQMYSLGQKLDRLTERISKQ